MSDPDHPSARVQVCFVCLGNICRSPTAEGVMARLVADDGLTGAIGIDSAGTAGYHIGSPPDPRSAAEALRRGTELTSRARQFHPGDFYTFDLVLAMDSRNLADLHDLAPEAALRDRAVLLRTFDPTLGAADDHDVPDPYHGGPDGFADVYDMIDRACRGLLDHLRHSSGPSL